MRTPFSLPLCHFGLILLVVLIGSGCSTEHKGALTPNIAPISRLANVPPNNYISKNPRLTLYWVGDDPDGYVVGFRYRWNFRLSTTEPFQYKDWSTILNIGIPKTGGENFALMTDAPFAKVPDVYKYFATLPPEGINPDSATKIDRGDSILIGSNEGEAYHVWASNPSTVRYPVHVNPNGGTFIFDSQDTLNPHTFLVEGIDNLGDTSAPQNDNQVTFETPQVVPPHAEVTTVPTDTIMVSDIITDVFPGISFKFQGFDPNSRTVDFSWVIDKDEWPPNAVPWSRFSSDPSALVSALNFVTPKDTTRLQHTIYVRARNEFGSIDTLGYFLRARIQNGTITGYDTVYSRAVFYCVYPKWVLPNYPKRILLLNHSYGYTGSTDPTLPSRDSLDAFYASIFDANGYAGKYDIIRATSSPKYWPNLQVLAKYSSIFLYSDVVNVTIFNSTGIEIRGDLIKQYLNVSGKIVITGWALPFQPGMSEDFMNYVAHLTRQPPPVRASDTAYIGANAIAAKGYPDLRVDSAKAAPWNGALTFISAGRAYGFGEIIYTFHESHEQLVRSNPPPPIYQTWEGRTIGIKYDGLTYKVVYFGFPLYYHEKAGVQAALRKAFVDIGE